MEFKNLKIEEYIKEVSKKSSVPGGGSVLALVNALAASLLLMVCNFTIDKKNYEQHQNRLIQLINNIAKIKDECHQLIDDDTKAFSELMTAFSSKDKEMISKCSYQAAYVPYRLLKNTDQLIEYAKEIILIGNKNLISDAEIAYQLLKSSIDGSKKHIEINLNGIDNPNDKEIFEKFLLERE